MSKPVKTLIRNELADRFKDVKSLAVVGLAGVGAVATNGIRNRLLENDIRLLVVKNSLARQAFRSVGLEAAADLLSGPCAIAYGGDSIVSVVRELMDIKKQEEAKALTVKAAVLEGEAYGSDRIEAMSRFPTREEALAKLAACVLGPGSKLSGCMLAPGGKLAALVKAIEEKQDGGESTEQAA
ncbi:MAG: 50S ribosomal protein L10 [Phycisphaerae bacterium]|jgi:large subunit ribosomal protein L10|nr:50S ribosomal protein L10 [Phycisphaerae bacterium]